MVTTNGKSPLIVRSRHRLRTFKDHLHSGTLPEGYSPNINPAIGSNSSEFLNNLQNNLPKYGIEQLKLSIQERTKLIVDSFSKQSNSLLEKLKHCCSTEDYNLLTNKLISLETKLDNELNLSSFRKSSNNKPPKANDPPFELHDLSSKQKRIHRRKWKKNRPYLNKHDYLGKCQNKYNKCDDSNYVVNLSTVDLSEAEVKLLSKGLSFCPTLQKIDWI